MEHASEDHLRAIVYDVFLPTSLPDYSLGEAHEGDLITRVLLALEAFESQVGGDMSQAVSATAQAIGNFHKTRKKFGGIEQTRLQRLVDKLAKDSGESQATCGLRHDANQSFPRVAMVVPLHVKAQNAGIIIRSDRDRQSAVFDLLELTPRNREVVTTKGRLQRCLPSISVTIRLSIFAQSEFRRAAVATMAKMSEQHHGPEAADDDSRSPELVTELLASFLLASGTPTKDECAKMLWKNTRDEVTVSETWRSPWKRSPVWLLLRVALQQTMMTGPTGLTGHAHHELYKRFMVFFMGRLRGAATEERLECHVIVCMQAKLDLQTHERWMCDVSCHLQCATRLLEGRWRDA